MALPTTVSVGNDWTLVAADVTAITLAQLIAADTVEAEIAVSASTPDEDDVGYRIITGDTLTESTLLSLGDAGAVYAKMLRGYGKIRVG